MTPEMISIDCATSSPNSLHSSADGSIFCSQCNKHHATMANTSGERWWRTLVVNAGGERWWRTLVVNAGGESWKTEPEPNHMMSIHSKSEPLLDHIDTSSVT